MTTTALPAPRNLGTLLRRLPPVTLPICGAIIVVAIWSVTLIHLWIDADEIIARESADVAKVAQALEADTARVIKDADRFVSRAKYEMEIAGTVDLRRMLANPLLPTDDFDSVLVTDSQGTVIHGTREQSATVARQPYFARHQASDTHMIDVSEPIVDARGRTVIALSRRINGPAGAFNGVVVLNVEPWYFTRSYNASLLGDRGVLAIQGTDGVFRARRVGDNPVTTPDGRNTRIHERWPTQPAGTVRLASRLDDVERVLSYRKLANYPIIVVAGRAVDEVLSDHTQQRRIYLAVASVATAFTVGFFAVIMWLMARLRRSAARLRAQRRFLRTILDHVPAGITVRAMRGKDARRYVIWNESNSIIFGGSAEESLGKTVRDIMRQEYADQIEDLDRQMLASPMPQNVVQARNQPGRGDRTYSLIRAPIFDDAGEVEYIMTSASDITRERAQTDELRLASRVFETTMDAIVMSDAQDRIVRVNAAFTRLTGFESSEVAGLVCAEAPFEADADDDVAFAERLQSAGHFGCEVTRRRKDGETLDLWMSASCVRDERDAIVNYVRVYSDISTLKNAQRKLEELASLDTLTGIPNRRLYFDRLEQAIRRAERSGSIVAVLFVDLDKFKQANDTYGHAVGDLVLREAAARLTSSVRAGDSVGRLGGDEFAIVMEDLPGRREAERAAARIVDAMRRTFLCAGHRISIGASIGIALCSMDGADAATLLRRADEAMYRAKQGGRNRYEFASPAAVAIAAAQ